MNHHSPTRRLRNTILTILILAGLVSGYFWLRKQRYRIDAFEPQFTTVVRGDLTIPITSAGVIRPEQRIEIKSKASGEVIRIGLDPDSPHQQGTYLARSQDAVEGAIEIYRRARSADDGPAIWLDPDNPNHHGTFLREGDLINRGDLLIQLDPADERRSVERLEAEAKLARASVERARIEAEEAYPAQVRVAEVTRDRIKYEYDRVKEFEPGLTAPLEVERITRQYEEAQANLKLQQARLQQAKQEVIRAQANYDKAKITLDEARERLDETTIRAPIDGQVVRINTRVGEVIQGGKTTITGGTVLMVLADISNIYVTAEVDEADIGRVRDLVQADTSLAPATGDVPAASGKVSITADAFPQEEFEGVISRIRPEPQKTSYVTTYDVEILITSTNRHLLMLGMDANVSFTAQSVQNVLLLDRGAFKSRGGGEIGVYVPVTGTNGKEKPEFKPVKVGITDGARTQILTGLAEGDRVYTKLPLEQEEEEED